MRILGIDPGSKKTGYGILEESGLALDVVDSGVIHAPNDCLSVRLGYILKEVQKLIDDYKPDAVAVETVFFSKNVKSLAALAQARGAALAAAGAAEIEVFEYSPTRVKQTVTGHGKAAKEQVRAMLRATLGQAPKQLDASDALAIALCHQRWYRLPNGGANR